MIRDEGRAFARNAARTVAESPDLAALGIVALVFAASRAWLASRGVAFDVQMLQYGYQFLDPVLLVDDARRSLMALHSQPPLMNAFLAVVLDLFPARSTAVFFWIWKAMGLALAWGAYLLMREVGVRRVLATVLACVATISPGIAMYEYWLLYTHPIACAQVLMCWMAARHAMRGGAAWAGGALAIAAALALTRSVYHPLWYGATAAFLVFVSRKELRRRVLLLALPGGIALAALVAKNGVMFGTWSTSSWLGMSLGKVAVFTMAEADREHYVEEGVLPAVMLVDAFEPFSKYAHSAAERPEPTGIPALDDDMKSTGWANMNNIGLIGVSREFGAGARTILFQSPGYYVRSLAVSTWQFFKPTSECLFLMENVGRVRAADKFLNAVLFGRVGEHEFIKDDIGFSWKNRVRGPQYIGFFLPAWMGAIMLHAVFVAWRMRRAEGRTARNVALFFVAVQIAWVSFFGLVLEVGENNRFRAEIEPLTFVYAALLLEAGLARLAGRRHSAG